MPELNKNILLLFKEAKNKAGSLVKNSAVKAIALLAFFLVILIGIFSLLFWGRIYPNTHIAGVNVGGMTQEEASKLLSSETDVPETITVQSENQDFLIELKNINARYDFQRSAARASNLYRTGNVIYDIKNRVASLFGSREIGLFVDYDNEKLEENISVIAGQVAVEPIYPSLTLQASEVVVQNGSVGYEIKRERLKADIGSALSYTINQPVYVERVKVDPTLSQEELDDFKNRGEGLIGKRLTINFEDTGFTYQGQELLNLLSPNSYNQDAITSLVEVIADEIEREPQNPIFEFANQRVQEFAPAKEGVSLKKDGLKEMIIGNLRTLETSDDEIASIETPVETTSPEIQTHEVNDLGINELIGRGTSTYRGSIASRVHNIGVASQKFQGVLVPPGEVFSFNEVLGDVSAYTGYQQAYIIKDGKTVLGDGGGVCQVSTTLFRAILDAGLPVVERRAHSYRVGYYEQGFPPGFDATIYSPITDLKFENNTPEHLLIQTLYEPSSSFLAFEIYGTDDGRVATTTEPIVYDVVEPPEAKYVDDPSLPQGEIKQIEYKAWGAKATFDYTVKKGGEVLSDRTFYSNYQPWQAIYLRGVGPAN